VGGRTVVRHHLLDFGSTLGSGTLQAQSPRAGNEFLWESRPTFVTMLTLGFYVRPWIKVPYPDIPSLGRIESDYFQPEDWKPEYPNTAFTNARPEDLFWAARILSSITDDGVRAVVRTGQYSHPKATEYLSETLIVRKNKVVKAWLNGTNPIVNATLSPTGLLTFENASQLAGASGPAERYTIQWMQLDNATATVKELGAEQSTTEPRVQMSEAVIGTKPDYVAARVRAFHKDFPAWSHPVMLYFRKTGESWSLVGLERNP
jgi:hypothetical protein